MFLPDPLSAIYLSVEVGLWCVVIGLPFAIFFGWILARKKFPGKSLFGTLLLAPLVLPPVVTGLLLLKTFKPSAILGRWLTNVGIQIPFSFVGVVIAALVVGLPLYVIAARHAFETVDRKYEEVAATLGKKPRSVFFLITLPLALPGILAGALLTFARAIGEFGATIVIAGNMEGKTRTVALAIYTLLESPDGESVMSHLLFSSLALAFGALLFYELLSRWQRRRLEIPA
jgi:molybdate transport system permease protein